MAQVHLYGIVEAAGGPLELPAGIAGMQPELHVRGDIAAIVSTLPDGLRQARAADARAHEELLRKALEGRDAVLPARFGSVYPDVETLDSELLAPASDELEQLLGRFAGRVELDLRALYLDHEAILRSLVHEFPGLAELKRRAAASGSYHAQIELGEALLGAFERRRNEDRAFVRSRLVPLAHDWRERSELPERMAAQFSFLVDRGRVGEFEHASEEVAKAVHETIRLRLVGPVPPYSFVAAELDMVGAR